MWGTGGGETRREGKGCGVCTSTLRGVCFHPPTSMGLSSVEPFQFSLTQVNMRPSTGQGTHVLIFNYIVCAEYIMAPPGNGSCRQ